MVVYGHKGGEGTKYNEGDIVPCIKRVSNGVVYDGEHVPIHSFRIQNRQLDRVSQSKAPVFISLASLGVGLGVRLIFLLEMVGPAKFMADLSKTVD